MLDFHNIPQWAPTLQCNAWSLFSTYFQLPTFPLCPKQKFFVYVHVTVSFFSIIILFQNYFYLYFYLYLYLYLSFPPDWACKGHLYDGEQPWENAWVDPSLKMLKVWRCERVEERESTNLWNWVWKSLSYMLNSKSNSIFSFKYIGQ